jgi:hypothetical protein
MLMGSATLAGAGVGYILTDFIHISYTTERRKIRLIECNGNVVIKKIS